MLLLPGQHGILVEHILAFLVVLIQCHAVQFRDHLVQLLQVALVCLLTNTLGVGVAVAAGHGLGLTHGVHHGNLAHLGVLIGILLVQGIAVQIVAELLPVHNLVENGVDLIRPGRLVFSRLIRHLLLKQCVCLLYGVALLVVPIVKACIRRRTLRSRSCLGGTAGRRVGAVRQRTPGIGADDAVYLQFVLGLVVLDGGLGLRAESAVHIEAVAVAVQQLL